MEPRMRHVDKVLPFTFLLATCSLLLPRVSADCNSQCSFYANVIGDTTKSNVTSSQCLLDCANCLAANNEASEYCSNYFSPVFNQAGGYVSSTCSNLCQDMNPLPAWAIVAISLGSLAILGIITCVTFCFVLRCKRLHLEALRIKHQQVLPSSASVSVPMPAGSAPNATVPGPVPAVAVNVAEPCVGYPAVGQEQGAKVPLMYPVPPKEDKFEETSPAGYPTRKGDV